MRVLLLHFILNITVITSEALKCLEFLGFGVHGHCQYSYNYSNGYEKMHDVLTSLPFVKRLIATPHTTVIARVAKYVKYVIKFPEFQQSCLRLPRRQQDFVHKRGMCG